MSTYSAFLPTARTTPKPSSWVPGSMPSMIRGLSNAVEAGVGTEDFRNLDVAVLLVVFQQGRNDSRKGQGAAVQGVHELGLPVLVLVAARFAW